MMRQDTLFALTLGSLQQACVNVEAEVVADVADVVADMALAVSRQRQSFLSD